MKKQTKKTDWLSSQHFIFHLSVCVGPDKKYREEQEKDFVDAFKELDNEIPLVCVCGNHDVGNTPTARTVSTYRNVFGDDYFSFWIAGLFIYFVP